MKNLFLVVIFAFAFSCEDNDSEPVRRNVEVTVDARVLLEDTGASDATTVDSNLPPPDMVLPVTDSMLVDMEDLADMEVVVTDADAPEALPVVDSGEVVIDASLSDMQ